jgi:hypothetical protein
VVPAPDALRLLAADAEQLMKRLIEESRAAGPTDSTQAPGEAERPPDQRRVIEIPAPQSINPAQLFLFEDVTGRGAAQPQLTLEQRRAVVEAYRRAIARERTRQAARGAAGSGETRPDR